MEQELNSLENPDGPQEAAAVSPIDVVKFVASAAKRNRKLAVSVGVGVAVLGVTIALTLPSKFESESRILAVQSAAVTAALSNPNRPVPNIEPFAGSTEILTQKSNLRWLVTQSNLRSRWSSTRTLPFRFKDAALEKLFGRPSEEAVMRAFVDMLGKQMAVYRDSSTLTIHVAWADPESAYRLAQFAQSRFLDLRRAQELAAINAAIALNEDEVKRSAESIEQSLQELIRIKDQVEHSTASSKSDAASASAASSKVTPAAGAAPRVAKPAASSAPASSSVDSNKKLATQLTEIRQQIRDIENPWQRRIAELKFQLSDLRTSYGPEHPAVRQQEAKIQAASVPPPELTSLREKERHLLAELERVTLESSAAPAEGARTAFSSRTGPSQVSAQARLKSGDGTLVIAEKEEDPTIAPFKANLTFAIQRYSDAIKRLDVSRLELATSEAAFQYKYTVVTEPERPTKATKPKRGALAFGALGAALLLGLISGAVRDLLSKKIYDSWQVRLLGIRVLGELDFSKSTGAKAPSH